MRQTVVGAFSEYAAAQRAAEYLASQGIERDHIHVEMPEGAANEGGRAASSAEAHEDKSLMANVRSFFTEVFGPDSEQESPLHPGGRTAHASARVVVDVDEEWQVTEVCRKLKNAGALELDQQAWKSTGWSGFDEGLSPAYAAERVPVDSPVAAPGPSDGTRPAASLSASPGGESGRSEAHLSPYHEHWSRNYAALGGRYEDYEPAYRYGHALTNDTRYLGQSWEAMEPNVRSEWEASHPGSAWERVKEAVRHGWTGASGGSLWQSSSREYEPAYRGSALGEEYETATRYGMELAGEPRHQGQDWTAIEPGARSEWDRRHSPGGSAWESIKDTVRHAWERARRH